MSRGKSPAPSSRGRSPAAKAKSAATPSSKPAPVAVAPEAAADGGAKKAATGKSRQRSSKRRAEEYEFGGPLGASLIFVVSHILLYYVYFVLNHNGGAMFVPKSWDEVVSAASTVAASAAPTWFAAKLYLGFVALQAVLALYMPGLVLKVRF